MKKLLLFLFVAVSVVFQGCEGPAGPVGPEGPEGPAGPQDIARVFDVQATFPVSGNSAFEQFFVFPSDKITVLDSDVVLVYLLTSEDVVNNKPVKIWSPLPQTMFVPNRGIFAYNFDFSTADVRFFLEGNFNLTTLTADYLNNRVFRVVVVPADFASARKAGSVDVKDYNAVVEAYGIDDSSVKGYTAKGK